MAVLRELEPGLGHIALEDTQWGFVPGPEREPEVIVAAQERQSQPENTHVRCSARP